MSVSAPPVFVSPEPRRELNDEPFTMRLVVEAVVNDPYVVDAYPNRLTPVKVFESARRVVEEIVSDPPRDTNEPLRVIEELVRPVLFNVPVTVGVIVNAPAVGTKV